MSERWRRSGVIFIFSLGNYIFYTIFFMDIMIIICIYRWSVCMVPFTFSNSNGQNMRTNNSTRLLFSSSLVLLVLLLSLVRYADCLLLAAALHNNASRCQKIGGLLAADSKFCRDPPQTEKFKVLSFHHLEFYCGDATSAYKRSGGQPLLIQSTRHCHACPPR